MVAVSAHDTNHIPKHRTGCQAKAQRSRVGKHRWPQCCGGTCRQCNKMQSQLLALCFFWQERLDVRHLPLTSERDCKWNHTRKGTILHNMPLMKDRAAPKMAKTPRSTPDCGKFNTENCCEIQTNAASTTLTMPTRQYSRVTSGSRRRRRRCRLSVMPARRQ